MSLPDGLLSLVRNYEGWSQGPVSYIHASWMAALHAWPHEAGILADDRWTHAEPGGERRRIDRSDLARLLKVVDLADEGEVRRAFVLVVTWGSGTSNPRSYRNLPKALAASNCTAQLVDSAVASREGDLDAAFKLISLPGIGRSFFTKWFAFAGHVPGRTWQPLILDRRVMRTLNETLHVSTRVMAGSSGWSRRYCAYVRQMHDWSTMMCDRGVQCSSERLEWILFAHNGASAKSGH